MNTKPKVHVWKEKPPAVRQNMWRGYCDGCKKSVQFWFFGATLGYMLEHTRRCERFRYAWILANRPLRPVSSAVSPSDMSGQAREAEGSSHALDPSVLSILKMDDFPSYQAFLQKYGTVRNG